ncbi:hypothetical protein BS47DRAFT_1083472 [Hydnum rufescens UP504]|uniref:Uncharacterized protein n=1 Tax=Hydnum rufescens UP504 TaxID=1448309 RepID=A0A9P6BBD5_9AGAM|nr:hypothetical protein BS47DRAFT_1083472 [Hydnum rufescens UP504]
MQVSTERDGVEQQIVRSPYVFAPSSFPISRGTNMVHSHSSVKTYLYDSVPNGDGSHVTVCLQYRISCQ